ncbi:MAG: iron ABC transporter permease [Rhodobiaceae bacterium]|nr:iron ABC transporter permease [Rhodobiaceae bacterium]MCC0049064.1 iron ABC transporter permease [Rhodobiaceae bacterium]
MSHAVRALLGTRPAIAMGAFAVIALAAMPIAAVLLIALSSGGSGTLAHLVSTVLPESARVTVLLMAGVGLGTAATGVCAAWLISSCRFPGKRLFEIALVLPLAMPLYITAFAYIEFFDYTGPLQTLIRHIGGYTSARDYWFPDIRSLPGAIFIMSSALYPYVYLTSRIVFLMQSATALNVARTLGRSALGAFWSVALPLARPAIVAGVTLAMMECLNDIGAVELLGVRTLTFAVFDTWLNRGSLAGAAQIAAVMLAVVALLVVGERMARRKQRFDVAARNIEPARPVRLTGWRAAAVAMACAAPVVTGFLIPGYVLLDFASRRLDALSSPALHSALINSLTLASATAATAILAALAIAYAARLSPAPVTALFGRIAVLGYAVPGTVLGIGVLIPLAGFDNWLDGRMRDLFGIATGLLLTGSGAAIVYACSVRFLAVSFGTIEAGLGKISGHMDMAARTLGRTLPQTLAEIHLPLMRKCIATAGLLVFVDTLKELSATILLRPFNFDTLATLVYQTTVRGAYEDAALPSLAIVMAGLVPVILLVGRADSEDLVRVTPETIEGDALRV